MERFFPQERKFPFDHSVEICEEQTAQEYALKISKDTSKLLQDSSFHFDQGFNYFPSSPIRYSQEFDYQNCEYYQSAKRSENIYTKQIIDLQSEIQVDVKNPEKVTLGKTLSKATHVQQPKHLTAKKPLKVSPLMFQAPKEKIISSLQIFGHTITEMYSMTEDEIQLVVFDCEGNFDSEVVFKQVRDDIIYNQLTKMRSNNLAKMRTMIVRRALDELVNKKVSPSSKKSDKPFKRMTNTDRNRYQLAAIPEPPSRMNASYMEEVFAISEVSEFFCEFLKGKLKSYLKRANEQLIDKLQVVLNKIIQSDMNAEQKAEAVRKAKKPYTKNQIMEFLEEGALIYRIFCKPLMNDKLK